MEIFKSLLKVSLIFATCNIMAQTISASDVTQSAVVESLFPTRVEQELIRNLDEAALQEAVRITLEESRPANNASNAGQPGNTANLKLRAELIRQEILTMNIMKIFAVTASIASIAAGSYIFLLLFNK